MCAPERQRLHGVRRREARQTPVSQIRHLRAVRIHENVRRARQQQGVQTRFFRGLHVDFRIVADVQHVIRLHAQLRRQLAIERAVPFQRVLLIREEEAVPAADAAFFQHPPNRVRVKVHVRRQHDALSRRFRQIEQLHAGFARAAEMHLRLPLVVGHLTHAVVRNAQILHHGAINVPHRHVSLRFGQPRARAAFRLYPRLCEGCHVPPRRPLPFAFQRVEEVNRCAEGAQNQRIEHIQRNHRAVDAVQPQNRALDALRPVPPRGHRLVEPEDFRQIRVLIRRKIRAERRRQVADFRLIRRLPRLLRPHPRIPLSRLLQLLTRLIRPLLMQKFIRKGKHLRNIGVIFAEFCRISRRPRRGRRMFTVEHAVAAVPPETLRKEIQHDGKRNVLRHHNVLFRQRRVVGRAPQPQIAPNHLVPNGVEAVTRHRLLEERIPHRIAAQLVLQHTVRMNRAHEAVAVFALPDRVAHHEVKVVFFRQRDGGTVKIHRHKIVAVQKSEVLARRRIRTGHPRREKPAVLRMRQHPKAAGHTPPAPRPRHPARHHPPAGTLRPAVTACAATPDTRANPASSHIPERPQTALQPPRFSFLPIRKRVILADFDMYILPYSRPIGKPFGGFLHDPKNAVRQLFSPSDRRMPYFAENPLTK